MGRDTILWMEGRSVGKRSVSWLLPAILVGAPFIIALALKAWLVFSGLVPFNADEAIVALMARHITQGARPVFFYGQAYMGSLDAFLIAGAYTIFGQQVWVIRLVQILLYLGTLGTTIWLGHKAFNSWLIGIAASWMMAVPTVNVTLYTTASIGNYGEALLLGNLILLTSLRIGRDLQGALMRPVWPWFVWGFLVGLGAWAFGLTLVYSLPSAVFLVFQAVRPQRSSYQVSQQDIDPVTSMSPAEPSNGAVQTSVRDRVVQLSQPIGLVLTGWLLGSAPWWGFAVNNGFEGLIRELGGSAIAGVEGLGGLALLGRHLVSLLLLGTTVIFGLRPPWEVRWLALPLMPFALAFWVGVLAFAFSRLRIRKTARESSWLLVGVMLTLVIGFLFTPFGADPSGRYFLPLAVPLALFAAALIDYLSHHWGRWVWTLIPLLLIFNLWGTLESARRYPPGITTQFDAVTQVDHRYDAQLIQFLLEHDERRGYTNYWVAYPLAFLSQEELIFVPRLPYHTDFRYTSRDDRYEPYHAQVQNADRIAYITARHPDLNLYLRSAFEELGLSWQEAEIGEYTVFYSLSQVVRPQEIGLGGSGP